MQTLHETWRPVPGYEGRYEVSDQGRVRSLWAIGGNYKRRRQTPLILKSPANAHGYKTVNLRGTVNRPHEVHRLVCLAFHGPPPTPRHTAAHRDGLKGNCWSYNLRWATWEEQALDRRRHGTAARPRTLRSAQTQEVKHD